MTSLIYNTGTVTVSNGSAVVTGSLTGWAVALVTGGIFSCAGMAVPIVSVEDDTHLTLAYDWPGTSVSGEVYAISRESSEATARAATWTVDRLAKLAQTPWGTGVIPDGRGTLAERNAVTPLPNDDYCWLRIEVDQPAELYFRDGGVWLGPYALRGEQGTAGVGSGGYGLPVGGTTGQVPRKASGTDGDVAWGNAGDVVGPSSAVNDRLAVYDGTTGKLLKDGGKLVADLQPTDALLTAIAALTTANGKFMAFTGADTVAVRDVVGTVAQSSGVPTGAIFEKGSNSNGDYVKYADGTMLAWKNIAQNINMAVANGSLFSHDEVDQMIWTYPVAFSAVPTLSAGVMRTTWDARRIFAYYNGSSPVTTTQAKISFTSTVSSSTLGVSVLVSAFGRWF